jgi:type I restriction enzyme, S subunit
VTVLSDIDSRGVKWMGEVSPDWQVRSVKHDFSIQLGKMLQNRSAEADDQPVPYLKALHVLWGRVETNDLPEMWASPKEIQQYGVELGDLLVCEGGEVGRAGVVHALPVHCIMQNSLHRIRGKGASDVRFLQYILHAVGTSGWFDVLCSRATIAHFTGEKFSNLRIPTPDIYRQRAIAAFLDRETSRIDALIEKKRRQVELLQEKRAALISHVVTRGLNPKMKMKDSGIGWIGEIPRHWDVIPIKRVAKMESGHTPDKQVEEYWMDCDILSQESRLH